MRKEETINDNPSTAQHATEIDESVGKDNAVNTFEHDAAHASEAASVLCPDANFPVEPSLAGSGSPGNLKSRAVRGASVTFLSQGVKFVMRLVSTAILARLLRPADFGMIAMVTVITGFIGMFKDAGLSMATIQRETITQRQLSALFWINTALGAVLMVSVGALAPIIAWFYAVPQLVPITLVLATTMAMGGMAVQHQALLRRKMELSRLAVIEVASVGIGIMLGVAFAWYGFGYWSLVVSAVSENAAGVMLSFLLCRWMPNLPMNSGGAGALVRFGGNVTGFNAVNYFARNADNFLIGWWWGATPLGVYSRAYNLLMMPLQQINSPVSAVALPILSRVVTDSLRYRRIYLQFVEKVALLTMPLVAFLGCTSDLLIRVVLGPGWDEAARIFSWLALAGLVQPVANTAGWLFISQDRTREMFRWGVIGSGSAVASFAVGLPFGARGVAASYALCGILFRTPLLFWFIGRKGPIRTTDFYRALAFPAQVSAVIIGLVLAVRWVMPLTSIHLELGVAVATFTVTILGLCLSNGRMRGELPEFVRELRARKTRG